MNTAVPCHVHNDTEVNEFLLRFNNAIMQSCRKHHLSPADTDAVRSEVLYKFFVTGKAKLNPLEGNEEGYVRRIANNCAIDILRAQKNDMTNLDDPDVPMVADAKADFVHDMNRKDLKKMLRKGLYTLKKNCKDKKEFYVFQRAFVEETEREEVAKEFDISLYEVSAIKFRLKMDLRKIMEVILEKNGWDVPGKRCA